MFVSGGMKERRVREALALHFPQLNLRKRASHSLFLNFL
jgi:hypothetical protein